MSLGELFREFFIGNHPKKADFTKSFLLSNFAGKNAMFHVFQVFQVFHVFKEHSLPFRGDCPKTSNSNT